MDGEGKFKGYRKEGGAGRKNRWMVKGSLEGIERLKE